MALRSNWKGYFKISLVSIPMKDYSAVSPNEGGVHFHQLHGQCNSRIRYAKTSPIHGTVPNEEIVTGYEYAKGQYVIVSEEEIDRLRSENDKAVTVVAVVPTSAIDPVYLTDRTSYLVPDVPVGHKPYALVQKSLADQDLVSVGQTVRQGRNELVMIRPTDNMLAMTVLSHANDVSLPSMFADEVPKASILAAEMKLTNTLLDSFHRDHFDISDYHDQFTERITELIEAKVAGKEVVTPGPTEEPQVINLMDALRKSVVQAKATHAHKPPARPAPRRKAAASMKPHAAVKRKRKTG